MINFNSNLLCRRGKEIHWIDSLKDLYSWRQITKLQYNEFTDFDNLLNENNTEMLMHFNSLVRECFTFNTRNSLDESCLKTSAFDYQGLIGGTTAMVFQASLINLVRQNLFKLGYEEDVDYHVSTKDAYYHPYFFATNKLNMEKVHQEYFDRA